VVGFVVGFVVHMRSRSRSSVKIRGRVDGGPRKKARQGSFGLSRRREAKPERVREKRLATGSGAPPGSPGSRALAGSSACAAVRASGHASRTGSPVPSPSERRPGSGQSRLRRRRGRPRRPFLGNAATSRLSGPR
jgi:hypothetical protein